MRNNSKSAMLRMPSLLESRNCLLLKANPAKMFTNGDWTTFSIRSDLVVLGKTEAQKEQFVNHNARRRCTKKNFDGIHDRF